MTALDVVWRLFVHRPAEWQGFKPGASPLSPKPRRSYGMPVNSIVKSVFFSLVATLSMVAASAAAPESIQLDGQWNFALDPGNKGFDQPRENWRFPDTIVLPGVLTAQGFGEEPSMETQWTGGVIRSCSRNGKSRTISNSPSFSSRRVTMSDRHGMRNRLRFRSPGAAAG